MSASRSGTSEAAQAIDRAKSEILDRCNNSVTLSCQDAVESVYEVSRRSESGCCGTGGDEFVSADVKNTAVRLIRELPLGFPQPQVSLEPDGHINLEWYRSPRRVFSISIAAANRLHWAALIGTESPRGAVRYTDRIPQVILDQIARVFQG